MKRVCVSGYFNPLHVGHLEYFELSKRLGDHLTVIVNTDRQAIMKSGKSFMKEEDRLRIVAALEVVDEAILAIDEDGSVCATLAMIKPDIFAKGGDRTVGEVPETKTCEELGIEIVDGQGEKIRSSSDFISSVKGDEGEQA
jgi:cytidyltransferase-like protein